MGIINMIKGWWNGLFKKKVKEEFGISSITSESMNNAINNWISIQR